MVTQTAVVEKSPVSRVRRWNKVTGRYEWVTLTQQQIEADKRRAAFVAMFNPCGVA